jgi:type II secretory pathway component HofQ
MKKLLALLACLCAIPSYSQNITVDLKEAPIRSTIEMMFKQAGIKNYVIDNSVSGFVTCTLTDLPFENSLKIVMRASTVPLTYIKENDVWIIKERISIPPVVNPVFEMPKRNNVMFERIPLSYIDPFDLQSIFGNILFINQFGRSRGNGNNFGGGGRN